MTILHAIILGIVEGITEFLPISSTGHLILSSSLLGIPTSEFLKTFEIAIQSGAIISVALISLKEVWGKWSVIFKIAVAFIPTALIGFFAYDHIKVFLSNTSIVAWALVIGGVIMILVEWLKKDKIAMVEKDGKGIESITYSQSFVLGLFQAIAVIPGVSRSGATIIGGLLMNIPRKTLVLFSFLLAVPTLGAATGYDLLKTALSFANHEWLLLGVGAAVSAFVAYVAMRWLLKFISNHTFIPFGIYRIVVGVVFLLFIL